MSAASTQDLTAVAPHVENTKPGPAMSTLRRYTLLSLFCLAQFIDAFNLSALFSAIPSIKRDLAMTDIQAVWLISAFALTFASFLLLSGRISDVYNPKHAFAAGLTGLGALALGGGFLTATVPLLVIRALMGCMAALTIPSALTLLVMVFPAPQEQARAIAMFGASGAIANVVGLVIGALFVQNASWRWCFWFVACTALPVALAAAVFIPSNLRTVPSSLRGWKKLQQLDLLGVGTITAALVLLIFAVTSGTTAGWDSAEFIAPLVISVVLIVGFFCYETRIPAESAAIPPRTWFYTNFAVLFFVSILPFFWWACLHNLFITLWQGNFGWSALKTAAHITPLGIVSILVAFAMPLLEKLEPKWIILVCEVLVVGATAVFQYTDSPDKYWSYNFPAFIIGSGAVMLIFTNSNAALFRSAPPSMAGVVGAIYNCGMQLGMAVGYAAIGSVQAEVDARNEAYEQKTGVQVDPYAGRRTAFRVLLGFVCLQVLAVAIFMKTGQQIKSVNNEKISPQVVHSENSADNLDDPEKA